LREPVHTEQRTNIINRINALSKEEKEMMDQKTLLKQMLDFNKTAFDSSFKGIVMLQEQAEQIAKSMRDQATWLPEEGKKAIDEWVGTYKSHRDDFKTTMDDNFKKMETYIAPDQEQAS
jgi:hypothetical protein